VRSYPEQPLANCHGVSSSFLGVSFLVIHNHMRFHFHVPTMPFSQTLSSLAILLSLVCASEIHCPITHDGRIPSTLTKISTFDTPSSPYSPDFVKGQDLKFSDIIRLPNIPSSHFDLPGGKSLEVTITPKSIFRPGTSAPQTGFRRVGLVLAGNSGTDASTTGVKTFHWSVRDTAKPLNTSHEYINVWHERNDFSGSQFNFQTGTLIGRPIVGDPSDWKLLDRKDKVIWQGKKESSVWQNFAITLDYGKK
jgi:hypothetical protein